MGPKDSASGPRRKAGDSASKASRRTPAKAQAPEVRAKMAMEGGIIDIDGVAHLQRLAGNRATRSIIRASRPDEHGGPNRDLEADDAATRTASSLQMQLEPEELMASRLHRQPFGKAEIRRPQEHAEMLQAKSFTSAYDHRIAYADPTRRHGPHDVEDLQSLGPRIQRHASWEHRMLGDVDPADLEVIASGLDVAAGQTVKAEDGRTISGYEVLHTIDQEIERLQYFASNPPAEATETAAEIVKQGLYGEGERAQELAAQWQIRLVSVPLKDRPAVLTYGEVNTLPDFFGSVEEIRQTDPDMFRNYVDGIREESIRKFMRLRNEIGKGLGQKKVYDPNADEHRVGNSMGNTGRKTGGGGLKGWAVGVFAGSDAQAETKMMGEVGGGEEKAKLAGKEETSYSAGLARNACHFAPQSWHSWAAAHKRAEALAKESWAESQKAEGLARQIADISGAAQGATVVGQEAIASNQHSMDEARQKATVKRNEALLENAFGDHFLQDSYAAGHLINKTLIMQWFAQWLDTKGAKRDYTSAQGWRQIQQVAYGQPGLAGKDLYQQEQLDPQSAAGPTTVAQIGDKQSNDPQSVENMEGGDWTARFAALGLSIPNVLKDPNSDAFELFTWWQAQAAAGKLLESDAGELLEKGPISKKKSLTEALIRLIDDGVVYYNWYSTRDRAKGARAIGFSRLGVNKSLRLKAEYIPRKPKDFKKAVKAAKGGDSSQYTKMAQAITYADYHRFLNHGYLQLASNVLHDHFCKEGLDVATEEGDAPYKIYGDNAMLGRESAKMVKYSATTSNMSRDSIYELAESGTTDVSTAAIAARFPTYVRPSDSNQNLSLADWHGKGGALKTLCWKTIFPSAASLFSKSTAVASDKLVEKVSKDDTTAIHSGEAF